MTKPNVVADPFPSPEEIKSPETRAKQLQGLTEAAKQADISVEELTELCAKKVPDLKRLLNSLREDEHRAELQPLVLIDIQALTALKQQIAVHDDGYAEVRQHQQQGLPMHRFSPEKLKAIVGKKAPLLQTSLTVQDLKLLVDNRQLDIWFSDFTIIDSRALEGIHAGVRTADGHDFGFILTKTGLLLSANSKEWRELTEGK